MNKTAIKNYAIWARNKLIADISYKAGLLGITEKGIKSPLPQSTQTVQFFDIGTKEPSSITGIEIQQRKKLVEEIERKAKQSDYATAYKNVIEEVTYTWFNRLIAIRFMEVNDYLPTRIRVLSSESNGKAEPDLVTHALEVNLDYSAYEKDRIIQLKHENKLDELFRMLFIKQCNSLNTNLPELFEKTSDFSELLLNVSFTDKEGIVYHLVNDISEDDFNVSKEGQVEIIGWLYQYYNEERKNEVINIYNGTVKKDDIPAATQLFTTDWVVRYMVDNSLGRYWIERNPESKLSDKLQYLVRSKTGEIKAVNEKIAPQEMTIFDPCMGSGHILVYAFDVLMEIYRENGYADREAAQLIVKNNIFGLDIDNRAYQLAYFAIIMKARSYDRKFLNREIDPNITTILESNGIAKFSFDGITIDSEQNKIGEYLIKAYRNAKEIGSLLPVKKYNYKKFAAYLDQCTQEGQVSIDSISWFDFIKPVMKKITKQAFIMSKLYCVVNTNPPYLNKFEGNLKKFVIEEYKPYSGDLFSVFIRRNFDYCLKNGYSSFMTPYVWMFIKTYEQLRDFVINQKSITTLTQLEYSAFEEAVVPICTFVLKNGQETENGGYFKLSEYKGGMEIQKLKLLEGIKDKWCGYYYESSVKNFSKIPGSPIAYWHNEMFFTIFESATKLGALVDVKKGLTTADNNRFLRFWWEVSVEKTNILLGDSPKKWYRTHKGGEFRRWYGNSENLLNWENNGSELKSFQSSVIRNEGYYFKECVSWNDISSSKAAFRFVEEGSISNASGPSFYGTKRRLLYLLGLCNSKVIENILTVLCATIHFEIGQIVKIPIIEDIEVYDKVIKIAETNVELSKADWNSFETSWNFECHPLINSSSISVAYQKWKSITDDRYKTIKSNEEELNNLVIKLYKMQNELSPFVDDKDITVRKANYERDIRTFVSYSVGCMYGRYSIDKPGLTFAGGNFTTTDYKLYIPDRDNIIPITDDEYFQDDLTSRFVDFVKLVYGNETLEENLNFIAKALGSKGNSSREIIRNYFVKEFFKDHCQIYRKRPIYWLFDSGKHNGFKALIYMHRYDENTIGNLRIDYLHRMQRIYENEIARMQDTIENSNDAREVTAATKRKEKLIKQLQETKEYDEKIAHLALARTPIDLDDGVKVNYEKVQTDRDGKKLDVLAKI